MRIPLYRGNGSTEIRVSGQGLSSEPDPGHSRAIALQDLSRTPVDLLVIGGGIVGAGVARDAAMRGLRVGLVEQHDFAFGTSSRSSRLLHGGLRYLAQGRLRLVREASIEKKIIHAIAPHLARPLPFVFPTYRGNRHWVLWQLKAGVKLYDLLCGGRNLGKSKWLSRTNTLAAIPGLEPEGLKGAVRYFDGITNDARLTIDTLRSAARHAARVLNYCRFTGAHPRGECWDCQLEDVAGNGLFNVRARAVVNATGPWADALPHSSVKLRVTKGVHLVVDGARFPVRDTVVMTEGKRILFAIPWGLRTILGTTDTDFRGVPEDVRTESSDISYVLEVTNRFFPQARLSAEDVLSCWAGLRPLVADPKGKPSDISRSHEIRQPHKGWWDIAGGKLTTYRLMAEQAVDQIVQALNDHNRDWQPCRTALEPLLPRSEVEGVSGLEPPEFSRHIIEHYCTREWALNLDDVMVRRTSWHYYLQAPSIKAPEVAEWMAQALGWTPEEKARQLDNYLELCSSHCRKERLTDECAAWTTLKPQAS